VSTTALRTLVYGRCFVHGGVTGVVLRALGGFPSWEARHRGRPSTDPEDPDRPRHRDTLFVNLRETSRTEVEGWCRDCRAPRRFEVAALLDAIARGETVVLR
jgi:hypothetical protein